MPFKIPLTRTAVPVALVPAYVKVAVPSVALPEVNVGAVEAVVPAVVTVYKLAP